MAKNQSTQSVFETAKVGDTLITRQSPYIPVTVILKTEKILVTETVRTWQVVRNIHQVNKELRLK